VGGLHERAGLRLWHGGEGALQGDDQRDGARRRPALPKCEVGTRKSEQMT
jgi:hypothetical protein